MWKTVVNVVLAIAFEAWMRWRDRRELKAAQDAQRDNEIRDRGAAADVAARLRDRAGPPPPPL